MQIFRKKSSPVDIEKTNHLQKVAWPLFYRARNNDYKFDKTSLELAAQAIDLTMRYAILPHGMYAKLNATMELVMKHLYGILVESHQFMMMKFLCVHMSYKTEC